jgi:hypothetical protein
MSKRENLIYLGILLIVVFLFCLIEIVYGKDRCQEYIPDIRAYGVTECIKD